jgi:hypothetical protein
VVIEEGVKREKKKVQRLDLTPSADKSDSTVGFVFLFSLMNRIMIYVCMKNVLLLLKELQLSLVVYIDVDLQIVDP